MQDHVHAGQTSGGGILFLTVEGNAHALAVEGETGELEQQRGRATGGVVGGGVRAQVGLVDAEDEGHHAADLRRGEELALALAALGGEVAHQVFVGVAEQVVAVGAVFGEIERWVFEDGDQVGEAVHHFLAAAQLVGVVEVGEVGLGELGIGLGERGDDLLVDVIADGGLALEGRHIGEARTLRDGDGGVFLPGVFVADVFQEQEDEHVILVLGGIHAAPEFVTGLPEGGVEFGFLEGHGVLFINWSRICQRMKPPA